MKGVTCLYGYPALGGAIRSIRCGLAIETGLFQIVRITCARAVDSRLDSTGESGWFWSALPGIFGHLSAFAIVENPSYAPPRFRRDYPLNLSISVSGGKESNSDSLSSGERNGNSPAHNLPGYQACGEMLRQGNGR